MPWHVCGGPEELTFLERDEFARYARKQADEARRLETQSRRGRRR